MNGKNGSTHEIGYKAVLVREETKKKLQEFRRGLANSEMYQERRLATAALEYCLSSDVGKEELMKVAKEILLKEMSES